MIIKEFIVKYQIYLKASLLYLIPTLFQALVGIIINPFLAKHLSPEDYSIIGYYGSFSLLILPITNFSIITYYVRNYFTFTCDRLKVVENTLMIALTVIGTVTVVISCIFFIIYAHNTKVLLPIYPYVFLAFVPIYLQNFTTMYLVKCRMERDAKTYAKIQITNGLLTSILAILLVVIFPWGATGRLVATLFATLIITIFCYSKLLTKIQFDWTIIKKAFNFGWPLSVSAIFWFFISGIDKVMLERLHDTDIFGLYNIGCSLAGYMAVFYTAISQTFEPDIYQNIATNNYRKVIQYIGLIVGINAVINLCFIPFAPFLTNILTAGRYIDAAPFAQIYALKNITITLYYSAITIIVGLGFTKSELAIRIIGAILMFFIYKILITKFGFYGGAWGQVLSFVFMATIATGFIIYKIKIKKCLVTK